MVLLTLVGLRFFQRYYAGGDTFFLSDSDQEALVDKNVLGIDLPEGDQPSGYDFSVMLKLVNIAHYVRDQTVSTFGAVSRRKKINFEEVQALLDALKRERAALRDYVWDLKGHARTGIPPRRYRSLMYYLEVLDGVISELREILARDPFFHKK